jgi:phosphoribosylformylglycinamidine synthase
LIKTGLLPYGKITDLQEDSPTLTFNTIGRHVAKVVYTKLVSDRSVWFGESEIGDVHAVAISHGEGRFVASPEEFVYLKEQGQIVAQYCTADGTVSGDPSVNPNGSLQNIEAVTSPDGRILGKMGHSERAGSGLYQNLTGNFDQKLFVSGVKYYS